MYAVQPHLRQEEPSARNRMAAGRVGLLGVCLRELGLSARQALLGRGQQPPHCLRPIGFDRMAVIVKTVAVQDAEIALRPDVARFGGLEQPPLQPVALRAGMSRRHG